MPTMIDQRHRSIQRGLLACSTIALLITCSPLRADLLPTARLTTLFPAGARQGTSVTVTVAGIELEEPAGLLFSHPGITAVPKTTPPRSFETEPQPVPNQFDVTISPDVPLGVYDVRVVGRNGLSSPRAFVVSDLPEVVCNGQNTSVATAMKMELNSIASCASPSADAPFFYEFSGQAHKPVLVHCSATSLDSKFAASMEMFDASGNQVAFSRSTQSRDAVIRFIPKMNAPYILKVTDLTYRSGPDFQYRLEVSDRPWIESIWPAAGRLGTTANFTIYGVNLPGGVPARDFDGVEGLEELQVTIPIPEESKLYSETSASLTRDLNQTEVRGFEYRLHQGERVSNPVFISAATAPVVIEREPNPSAVEAQSITPPCEVSGRFSSPQDHDWYSFTASKGQSFIVQLLADRLGTPADASLSVFHVSVDANGKETSRVLAEQDDPPARFDNTPFNASTFDPTVQFTADADGLYRILVRDLSSGDPRNVYRLLIHRAQGDFQLLVTSQALSEAAPTKNLQRATSPLLRRGGSDPVLVQVFRTSGFTGPVTLTAEGLPPGVSCPVAVIPAGQNQAPMVFSASADAPAWAGTVSIKGAAQINDQVVERRAVAASLVWDKVPKGRDAPARVVRDFALAVIPEVMPFIVAPTEQKIWETCRGGKLPVTARFERHLETHELLTLEVRGLPTAIFPLDKIPTQTLDPQAQQGTVEIAVPPAMTPGDYPCYLVAQTHGKYSKNPEAAKAAEEQKGKFESLIASLMQSVTEKEAALKAASGVITELMNLPDEPGSKEKIDQANAAKEQTEQALAQAKSILSEAQAELPSIVKRATDLANASKPNSREIFAASELMLVRVHELPFKGAITAPPVVKVGSQAEVDILIERLFGFQDGVLFEARLPEGIPGLSLAGVSLPATEQRAKMIFKTTPETPAGTYTVTIIVKATYNGNALQSERPLVVKVEAAE